MTVIAAHEDGLLSSFNSIAKASKENLLWGACYGGLFENDCGENCGESAYSRPYQDGSPAETIR